MRWLSRIASSVDLTRRPTGEPGAVSASNRQIGAIPGSYDIPSHHTKRKRHVAWTRFLVHETDLACGLGLSICLGVILGLIIGHPLGRLICGSALGVTVLVLYVLSYSLGTIWMIGMQQGLVVVTVFVWCTLLSTVLGGGLKLPLLAGVLG
jgi:hypothetical protein